MSDQRELVCEMLRAFYARGWATGTGGGICALESPSRLLLAPTGVHKELVQPQDLFVVDAQSGDIVEGAGDTSLRPSECKDVFRTIVQRRGAGAVLHSHALSAVLACDLTKSEVLTELPGHSDGAEYDDLDLDVPNQALAKAVKYDLPAITPHVFAIALESLPSGKWTDAVDIPPAPNPRYAHPQLRAPPR